MRRSLGFERLFRLLEQDNSDFHYLRRPALEFKRRSGGIAAAASTFDEARLASSVTRKSVGRGGPYRELVGKAVALGLPSFVRGAELEIGEVLRVLAPH
jgi:hypothetical protein